FSCYKLNSCNSIIHTLKLCRRIFSELERLTEVILNCRFLLSRIQFSLIFCLTYIEEMVLDDLVLLLINFLTRLFIRRKGRSTGSLQCESLHSLSLRLHLFLLPLSVLSTLVIARHHIRDLPCDRVLVWFVVVHLLSSLEGGTEVPYGRCSSESHHGE
ncbi:hypothetical protein PENTCL1PPCAC_9922, partial [Pristionchus entomophagus]